jgi:hypothetical protein
MSNPEGRHSYTVTYDQKPWTTNAERAGNRWERATLVKQWRTAFFYLAKQHKIPPLLDVDIIAVPHQKNGRLQDVGACNPAVKSAIDGLVDAHVMQDDSPKYLKSVTFLQPVRAENSLTLTIVGTIASKDTNDNHSE